MLQLQCYDHNTIYTHVYGYMDEYVRMVVYTYVRSKIIWLYIYVYMCICTHEYM